MPLVFKNNNPQTCTSTHLAINCDPSEIGKFSIYIPKQIIITDRSDLNVLNELLIRIHYPIVLGCTVLSPSWLEGDLNTVVHITITDILSDGSAGVTVTGELNALVQLTTYQTAVYLTASPVITLDDFVGCGLAIHLDSPLKLTNAFPICHLSCKPCAKLNGSTTICLSTAPEPVLTITTTAITIPTTFVVGAVIRYETVVCNRGNLDALDVTLADANVDNVISDPNGILTGSTTLAISTCTTVVYDYSLTAGDVIAADVTNTAIAAASNHTNVQDQAVVLIPS